MGTGSSRAGGITNDMVESIAPVRLLETGPGYFGGRFTREAAIDPQEVTNDSVQSHVSVSVALSQRFRRLG